MATQAKCCKLRICCHHNSNGGCGVVSRSESMAYRKSGGVSRCESMAYRKSVPHKDKGKAPF